MKRSTTLKKPVKSPLKKPMTDKLKQMPPGQVDEKFFDLIRKQSLHAFYRYGPTSKNAATVDFAKEAAHRLEKYAMSGNTEFLVDVATFAMCEFMYPHVEGSGYRPDPSSPGLVSGISSREIEELNKENDL